MGIMLIDIAVAFIIILSASGLIFVIGRLLSPKHVSNRVKESSYACGERVTRARPRISITMYKYLVFFAIIDSSVVLIAFGALAMGLPSIPILLFYLIVIVVSTLLLIDGGKE